MLALILWANLPVTTLWLVGVPLASSSSVLAQQSPISLGRCGRAEAIALVHRVDLTRTQSRREAESLTDTVSRGPPARLSVRQSFRSFCRRRTVLTVSAAISGRASRLPGVSSGQKTRPGREVQRASLEVRGKPQHLHLRHGKPEGGRSGGVGEPAWRWL